MTDKFDNVYFNALNEVKDNPPVILSELGGVLPPSLKHEDNIEPLTLYVCTVNPNERTGHIDNVFCATKEMVNGLVQFIVSDYDEQTFKILQRACIDSLDKIDDLIKKKNIGHAIRALPGVLDHCVEFKLSTMAWNNLYNKMLRQPGVKTEDILNAASKNAFRFVFMEPKSDMWDIYYNREAMTAFRNYQLGRD